MSSEQHQTTGDARRNDLRAFRLVTCIFAVAGVAGGALVGVLPDRIGISPDVARTVASVLVLAGVGNTLVLYYWQRLFGRP